MLTEVGQILNRDFTNSFEFDVSAAQAQFEALTRFVTKAAAEGVAAHVVERDLFAGLLQLGATLFGGFLKQVGPSDVGETATLDNGRVVSRLEEQHVRRLLTVLARSTSPAGFMLSATARKSNWRPLINASSCLRANCRICFKNGTSRWASSMLLARSATPSAPSCG